MYDSRFAYDTVGTRMGITLAGYSGGTWGSGNLQQFLAIGIYDQTEGSKDQYCGRVVFPNSIGWFPLSAFRVEGWQKMEIVFSDGIAKFSVNDTAIQIQNYDKPQNGFGCFRLGAFAGTTNPQIFFDDLSIVKTTVTSVDQWQLY